MRNDYGSLVEAWKVDLIIDRARRKGFRRDELEDIQQEIVLAILDFEYDPNNEAGATESTVLTALIDRQLAFLLRSRARRRKHEDRYCELRGVVNGKPVPDASHTLEQECETDVQEAISSLTPREQVVCAALARGESRRRVAKDVGVSRYELDQIIDGIGERFGSWALDVRT